jgi:DNA polymerase III delta prime subunit
MFFILTSPSEKLLLPTVQSRVQIVKIRAPVDKQIIATLSERHGVDKTQARQAWIMSGGEPYGAVEILEQGGSEQLKEAKRILGLRPYQRIATSKDMIKDREKSLRLTQDISRLCYLATTESAKADKDTHSWLRRLKLTQDTIDNLQANANVRLNMVNFLSNL